MGDKRVTASTAVFTLAPRINAAGRMGSPETAARLLLTADEEEAAALAEDIQQLNVERQAAEAAILGEVLERLKQQPERLAARILVLEGDNWHPGVVGIIASRLMERFGKPCIVLSVQDGVANGSGRSLPGFSLFDALTACKEVLTAYGGHSLAAGVTLEAARIDEFREAVNAYAAAVCPRMPVPGAARGFPHAARPKSMWRSWTCWRRWSPAEREIPRRSSACSRCGWTILCRWAGASTCGCPCPGRGRLWRP